MSSTATVSSFKSRDEMFEWTFLERRLRKSPAFKNAEIWYN